MADFGRCAGCFKLWDACRCGVNAARWTDEEKDLAYGPGWRARLDQASTEGDQRMTNTEASRARDLAEHKVYGPPQWPNVPVDLQKLIDQANRSNDEALQKRMNEDPQVRRFGSGATRHTDTGKYDYEGFLSPAVLQEFAKYMHHHRVQADGSVRDSDNWQKGMPLDAYMKSMLRHVMDLWLIHRGHEVTRPEDGTEVTLYDALGGILFNCQGYWHESLKEIDGTTD